MGRPSRIRNAIGAVLTVLVGLLYASGISEIPDEHRADAGEVDGWEVTIPLAGVHDPGLRG